MLKINDIKPLYDIPDYSIYIYYFLIFSGVTLSLFTLYYILSYFYKKRYSQEKLYFKKLKELSFQNPKQDAYTISFYARKLAKDERSLKLFEELEDSLLEYKYKKNTPPNISKESKIKLDRFMDSVDV